MPASTLYSSLTPRQSLIAVVSVTVSFIICFARRTELAIVDISDLDAALSDSRYYRTVAGRVHAGESYYDAAAVELPAHSYPTTCVFNWRLPAYAWIFGMLPDEIWGGLILMLCTIAATTMAACVLARNCSLVQQLSIVVSLAAANTWVVYPQPIYFMEIWSGILILISVCLYSSGRWPGAVAVGWLALVLRELALPYCIIVLALACWRHRWREVSTWAVALALYSFLFYLHFVEVVRRGAAPSFDNSAAWIAFGGINSILSSARMNFILSALPAWVTVIYLPLALLGLMGWDSRGVLPMKLTVVSYLGVFAMVGKPSNFYWGWLVSPLLATGIVLSPRAIKDLISRLLIPVAGRPVQNTRATTALMYSDNGRLSS